MILLPWPVAVSYWIFKLLICSMYEFLDTSGAMGSRSIPTSVSTLCGAGRAARQKDN